MAFEEPLSLLAFQATLLVLLLLLFEYPLGVTSRSLAESNGDHQTDALIVCYAVLILVVSFGVRINISASLTSALVVSVATPWLIWALVKRVGISWRASCRKIDFKVRIRLAVKLLPLLSLAIPLFPYFQSGSLFLHQVGPDLGGHLLSAATLREGRTYSDFVGVLKATAGEVPWWRLTDRPWGAADFKWALEVEFFLRSMRYGHAALTTAISCIFRFPVAEALLVAVCVSQVLAGFGIARFFRHHSVPSDQASLLSTIIVCSHSYIILQREGITAQLFALPLLVFLFTSLSKSIVDKLSVSDVIRSGLVVAALGVTMTEALQMFATLVLFSLVVVSLRFRHQTWGIVLPNILKVGLVAAVLLNLYLLDFLRVVFLRSQQSFRYTSFGDLGWEPISTLASLPYMKVTSVPGLNVSIQARPSVVIALTVLICAAICIFRRELALPVLSVALSAAITLFAVALTGGGYPLWKTTVMFQPIFILWVVLLLRKFLAHQTVTVLLTLYCSVILWSGLNLLRQYEEYSIKLKSDSFTLSVQNGDNKADQPFVLVTPLSSGFYQYLGSSISFGYANSEWGPIFRDEQRGWQLGFYYSCEIEGADRCKVIEQSGLEAKRLYLTDLTVEQLLDNTGRIRGDLLDQLVMETYGVRTKL